MFSHVVAVASIIAFVAANIGDLIGLTQFFDVYWSNGRYRQKPVDY